MLVRACLLTFLAAVLLSVTVYSQGLHRVDGRRGFEHCGVPEIALLESVEVSCSTWPCRLRPNKRGVFVITLSYPAGPPIHLLRSDIHADVRFSGLAGISGGHRVAIPKEVGRPACPLSSVGCPIYAGTTFKITKHIAIPLQARMAQNPMRVQFRMSTRGNVTLTCFRAPVIVL